MQPTISIITVVYNGEQYIEATIRSVLNQTYPNIEYVIIDGKSKDQTTKIISKYKENIHYFISEKDKGLYDAMNKGIQAATGDFLWFINAGDHIHDPSTAERMMALCTPDTDILYGEVMMVDEQRKHFGIRSEKTLQKTPEILNWKSLKKGMVVSHQAFLPKRSIAPAYGLDSLSADVGWVIDCLKASKKVVNTKLILADYLMGGISKKQQVNSWKDRYQELKKHYGFWNNLWNHFIIVGRALVSKLLGQQKY